MSAFLQITDAEEKLERVRGGEDGKQTKYLAMTAEPSSTGSVSHPLSFLLFGNIYFSSNQS